MALFLFILYLGFSSFVVARGFTSRVWEVGSAIYLFLATFVIGHHLFIESLQWLVIGFIVALIHLESLRAYIGGKVFQRATHSVPKLSKTEEEALNAGDVWFEQGIFTGSPDWENLSNINIELSKEEIAFLENETETLCEMIDDWDITQQGDLPEKVWNYMKDNGFFAVVIAKKYGGKGFSARAHSDIIVKIATRSCPTAVTMMVPNSLGPGELLQLYGTEEQKSHYLPRLAKGIDIPCFALTEPGAGSDATSIESEAVVVEKKVDGKKILGLQIKLNKRWITLAPVATLIGLAVDLKDPQGLLKGEGVEGITCVLIPRDVKNLEIGNRHLPGGQAFMNGTIRGENIFVPIDSIIGGQKNAGRGWSMLVECLSIGRSISLPALSSASSTMAYLTTGAFSRVRKQFNVEIAQFEGVQEKLSEIAGLCYIVNSTRDLTLAAVNEHKKPSVASAIAKYWNTEFSRKTVIDAMDVHGGRSVVLGPRNYLANAYHALPISITVEGANIMTRNLLIFGQGSMACHPYIRDEFYAIVNKEQGMFTALFWDHINYFITNLAKTIFSAWTGGFFIKSPKEYLKRESQQLTRLSYAFAWLSDISLMILGGDLKRKERLSARLGDGMSYLYLAMACIRQCKGKDSVEELHAKWATAYCFYQAQKALIDLCENFPNRVVGFIMKYIAFPWGQSMRYPNDKLSRKLAKLMTENNSYREQLIQKIYLSGDVTQPIDRVENAFQLMIKHANLYQKIADLKRCKWGELKEKLALKVENKELTTQEMNNILLVEQARWDAIQVDEFLPEVLNKKQSFSAVVEKSVLFPIE